MFRLDLPKSFPFAFLAVVGFTGWSRLCDAQTIPDPPSIGASFAKSSAECPTVILDIAPQSPAAAAGLHPGDRLIKVGDRDVRNLTLAEQITTIRAAETASLDMTLWRHGSEYTVSISPAKLSSILAKQNLKVVREGIFPMDFSEAEFDAKAKNLQFDATHVAFRVFPTHYPTDTALYYGGFEIYVFRDPAMVAVGGVEKGPASKAGLHWGDTILRVNGLDPVGLSQAKLETMFSSTAPLKMSLVVDRIGSTKEIDFVTDSVGTILSENGQRIVKGTPIPIDLDESDLHCFISSNVER